MSVRTAPEVSATSSVHDFEFPDVNTPNPRWAQFFSEDGGEPWEKNYENVFTGTGDAK